MRGRELAEGGGRTESCLAPMAERRGSRNVFHYGRGRSRNGIKGDSPRCGGRRGRLGMRRASSCGTRERPVMRGRVISSRYAGRRDGIVMRGTYPISRRGRPV